MVRVERRLAEIGDRPHNRSRGRLGEEVAIEILREEGYEILERNFEVRGGELDLVAEHEDTLCFVEIKVRSSDEFGTALEAVDGRKRSRMIRAAKHYLYRNDLIDPICRFDVLGIDRKQDGWQVRLVQDAFTVDGLF